jgi:putative hydrolase of the HAD superfamily
MLKALIFDMGGTLEDVVHKPEFNVPCGKKLLAYLARHGIVIDRSPEDFMQDLEQKNKAYRKWGVENRRELTPYELWSEWYLKDQHIDWDVLRVIADNVADIWERNFYLRTMRSETPALLEQVQAQGIKMGIISNTACLTQVTAILHEYHIRQYFDCIYLSSISGFRKPHPELFRAAARDLEAKPEESIYVGDTVSRDVRGSRLAGYLASIRIDSMLSGGSDAGFNVEGEDADYHIANLMEIPEIVRGIKEEMQ